MNTIWSNQVQNIGTLYFSRMLRFSDRYKENYRNVFCMEGKKRILEIGCGPGALTQSLARWYPKAEIIGIDRDTRFIDFAVRNTPALTFMEADATALPFSNDSFDVTISNTVQEHIEPAKFFGEQFRVLKPDGICLVLSARKGIHISADCISELSSFEQEIWERVKPFYQRTLQEYQIGQYAMSERELPLAMETYGFRQVSTEYITVNLTPDNPEYSPKEAYAMINAQRQTDIDAVEAFRYIASQVVSEEEILEMKKWIHKKYDKRMELYDAGEKQWDTTISIIMIVRGVK